MPWSPVQRDRLGIEKETLEKYFGDRITWIDPTGDTKVEVQFSSNSDKEYKLRIYIPSDFPNSCPKLFVVFPKNLVMRNGILIPSSSASFHTLERKDGFQSICHFYPPDWTADITLYQVFMKGRLWIEAYEGHLETGMELDHYLGHQEYTYDPRNPWVPDMDEEEGLAPTCPRNRRLRLNNEPVGGTERGLASIRQCNRAPRLLTNDTSTRGSSLQSRNSNSNSTITNARRLSQAPRQRASLRSSDVHSRR